MSKPTLVSNVVGFYNVVGLSTNILASLVVTDSEEVFTWGSNTGGCIGHKKKEVVVSSPKKLDIKGIV